MEDNKEKTKLKIINKGDSQSLLGSSMTLMKILFPFTSISVPPVIYIGR